MEEVNKSKKKQKGGARGEAIPVEDYNTEQRIAIRLLLDTIANTPDTRKIRTDIIVSKILPHFTTTQLSTLFRNNKLLLHWVRSADVWKKIAYIKIPEAELQLFETIIWEIVEDGPINYKWLLYIWEEWHFVQKFDFGTEWLEREVEYAFVEKEKEHPIFLLPIGSTFKAVGVYFPYIKHGKVPYERLYVEHDEDKRHNGLVYLFLKRQLTFEEEEEEPDLENFKIETEFLLESGNQRNFILILYTAFTLPGVYVQRTVDEHDGSKEHQDKIRGELLWNK